MRKCNIYSALHWLTIRDVYILIRELICGRRDPRLQMTSSRTCLAESESYESALFAVECLVALFAVVALGMIVGLDSLDAECNHGKKKENEHC